MYKFFYTYRQEVYGVLEHQKDKGTLSVELIRTNEEEEIKGNWFLKQLEKGNIDIAYDVDYLNKQEK